jgi:hypothetical protein
LDDFTSRVDVNPPILPRFLGDAVRQLSERRENSTLPIEAETGATELLGRVPEFHHGVEMSGQVVTILVRGRFVGQKEGIVNDRGFSVFEADRAKILPRTPVVISSYENESTKLISVEESVELVVNEIHRIGSMEKIPQEVDGLGLQTSA